VLAQVLAPGGAGMQGRSDIYNLTSSGETSWFGFAKAVLTEAESRFGSPFPNLVPILTADYPTPAKRPANSRLSCERLEQTFGVTLPHWEHALSLVLDTLTEGSSSVSPKA
jgi:dTDP-4-dehydrorhamnose reductase